MQAPPYFRLANGDAAVVEDDDLLHERQARPLPLRFSVKKGLEHALAHRRIDAGAVVFHTDAGYAARARSI